MTRVLFSQTALPAGSRISAVRYSSTAARYTVAPAPTGSGERVLAFVRALHPVIHVQTCLGGKMQSEKGIITDWGLFLKLTFSLVCRVY